MADPLGPAAISSGTILSKEDAHHEKSYNVKTGLAQKFIQGFTRDEVDEENHETCLEPTDRAIETPNDNTSEFKEIPTENIQRKKRRRERMHKKEAENLNVLTLPSRGSDASSGLQDDKVRDCDSTASATFHKGTASDDAKSLSSASTQPQRPRKRAKDEAYSLREENAKLTAEARMWMHRTLTMQNLLVSRGLPCPEFSRNQSFVL